MFSMPAEWRKNRVFFELLSRQIFPCVVFRCWLFVRLFVCFAWLSEILFAKQGVWMCGHVSPMCFSETISPAELGAFVDSFVHLGNLKKFTF